MSIIYTDECEKHEDVLCSICYKELQEKVKDD